MARQFTGKCVRNARAERARGRRGLIRLFSDFFLANIHCFLFFLFFI